LHKTGWRRCGSLAEEAGLAAGLFQTEMLIGQGGGNAAARGAVDEAELHEVRLVDGFDSILFLAEGGGEGIEADGTAGIFLHDREHEAAINLIEAVLVDAEHGEGVASDAE